jgi:phosphopantothenoylcysteine synthetase/decarboxylase
MKICITAGGTEEPIDGVRFLGNRSSGKLGALIATEALCRGHEVLLLRAARAIHPEVPEGPGRFSFQTFVSSADLRGLLTGAAAAFQPQVLIHAAAVADFLPQAVVAGKVSSQAGWSLNLVPNEKLAPSIRGWCPGVRLVVFKLEAQVSQEELFARARAGLAASGAELVVANLAEALGEDSAHQAWILDADRVLAQVAGKARIAKVLLDLLEVK